ncbi:MAG: hypothetical protein L0226_16685 [Acidobacteria bacterium]|nr:hypothetical protein [Acidobacteriota bacterium]
MAQQGREGKSRRSLSGCCSISFCLRGIEDYQPRLKGTEVKHAEEVIRRLGTERAWSFGSMMAIIRRQMIDEILEEETEPASV